MNPTIPFLLLRVSFMWFQSGHLISHQIRILICCMPLSLVNPQNLVGLKSGLHLLVIPLLKLGCMVWTVPLSLFVQTLALLGITLTPLPDFIIIIPVLLEITIVSIGIVWMLLSNVLSNVVELGISFGLTLHVLCKLGDSFGKTFSLGAKFYFYCYKFSIKLSYSITQNVGSIIASLNKKLEKYRLDKFRDSDMRHANRSKAQFKYQ